MGQGKQVYNQLFRRTAGNYGGRRAPLIVGYLAQVMQVMRARKIVSVETHKGGGWGYSLQTDLHLKITLSGCIFLLSRGIWLAFGSTRPQI